MDDLKDVLAKIRAAVGEETTPKIDGLLKQIEAGFANVADDLKAANAESKERKLKIRDLTGQLDDATTRAKEFEGKANNPDQAKELADLKQFKIETMKQRRAVFADDFKAVVKHANFEKAKDQFKLPQASETGEYDFSKMADADIEHNLGKLAEYQKIGFFAGDAQANGAFNMPRNSQTPPPAAPKTREELQAHVAAQMSRYK